VRIQLGVQVSHLLDSSFTSALREIVTCESPGGMVSSGTVSAVPGKANPTSANIIHSRPPFMELEEYMMGRKREEQRRHQA
jgi:hypothetical protein